MIPAFRNGADCIIISSVPGDMTSVPRGRGGGGKLAPNFIRVQEYGFKTQPPQTPPPPPLAACGVSLPHRR